MVSFLTGTPIRQEYLETVIEWISSDNVEGYMAVHQHDPDATELWNYFQSVIGWAKNTFTTYRRPMKGLPWGRLYNNYKDVKQDPAKLEQRISELFADDEILSNKGIYLSMFLRATRSG